MLETFTYSSWLFEETFLYTSWKWATNVDLLYSLLWLTELHKCYLLLWAGRTNLHSIFTYNCLHLPLWEHLAHCVHRHLEILVTVLGYRLATLNFWSFTGNLTLIYRWERGPQNTWYDSLWYCVNLFKNSYHYYMQEVNRKLILTILLWCATILNLVVKFYVNSFRNTVYMTALYDGSVSSALNYDFYVKSDEPCSVYILCYRDWHWYFNVKHLSCVIWNLTWVNVTKGIKYDPNKLSE